MGMTLVLDEQLEQQIREAAARHGASAEDYAIRLLREGMPAPPADAAVALIQSWIDEGDAEEQRETGDYLVRVLDEDRPSARKLFP